MITPDQLGQEPPRRRGGCRKALLITGGVIAAFIVIVVIVAVATGGSKQGRQAVAVKSSSATTATAAPATTAAASMPAPEPSPNGTFTGSCDYTLGSDPVGGTAQAVGDIDATNTGNVGIVVRLTITWPQEGHSPLKMSKVIRLSAGGERDVQFSRPITGDQVDLLQAYQTGHDYANGCTYHGDMIDTFGQPQQ